MAKLASLQLAGSPLMLRAWIPSKKYRFKGRSSRTRRLGHLQQKRKIITAQKSFGVVFANCKIVLRCRSMKLNLR
jgi:hypothetical protein